MECIYCKKITNKKFCSVSCKGKYARSKKKKLTQWSIKHTECVQCHSTQYRHQSKGLCVLCYSRQPKEKERQKKYGKKNRGKITKRTKAWDKKVGGYWKKRYLLIKNIVLEKRKLEHDINCFSGLRESTILTNPFCNRCKISRIEHIEKYKIDLHLHHIDRDRNNNAIENFEVLCVSCHGKESTKDVDHKKIQYRKGEQNNKAKLREVDVIKIRELYKTGQYTQRQLARIYLTTQSNIKDILKRKTWKHLP
jgi:predicted XRE-type DNA-binding protein